MKKCSMLSCRGPTISGASCPEPNYSFGRNVQGRVVQGRFVQGGIVLRQNAESWVAKGRIVVG